MAPASSAAACAALAAATDACASTAARLATSSAASRAGRPLLLRRHAMPLHEPIWLPLLRSEWLSPSVPALTGLQAPLPAVGTSTADYSSELC